MKPLLLYHQHLYRTNDLIEGRLLLVDASTNNIKNPYIASSGLPNNQRYDCLSSVGVGPIPPDNMIGIDHYLVRTTPIYMPQVRGVEGNFYKISPDMITIEKMRRGDFGVHFDANVPGSSGCVVLRTKVGWKAFEDDMRSLGGMGISQVPLLVSYSR